MRAAPVVAALAAAVFCQSVTAAEVVDVRVGLHPDFTRVVIELDASGGYRMTRAGQDLLLTLDAGARPARVRAAGTAVEWVELEPTPEGSVAHIRLAHPVPAVQEMVLVAPPRIVLDVLTGDEGAVDESPAEAPASASAIDLDDASRPETLEAPDAAGPQRVEPAPSGPIAAAEIPVAPARPASLPAPAEPSRTPTHAFTGFQMDDEAQYFAYLGVKRNVWEGSGLAAYVHLFGAGQSYEYESGGRDIDTDLQLFTPSLGLAHAFGDGAVSLSAHVGPRFEWKHEQGFSDGSRRDFEVGVFAQAEGLYWRETHSLQAIASYGSSDDFFFGRLRGKLRVASPASGCCTLFTGLDVAGMGNRDFSAIQTGPLLEVPVAGFSLLARGGYQYDSTFHSGAYGGLEIYRPF